MNWQLTLPLETLTRVKPTPYTVFELHNMDQAREILRMAKEFADDYPIPEIVDDTVLIASCMSLIKDGERKHLNAFIAYLEDKAIGFLVADCMPVWYNRRIIAEQRLWFVSKQFRGSRAAPLLIKAYEAWAIRNGATHLYTGTGNERYAEQTSRLLEQLGFKRVGSMHLKEI